MKKEDLLKALNKIAPVELAEEWDNCGMQVDLGKEEIDRVLLALEISDDIIAEAKEKQVDMVIAHHPVLFSYIAITSLRAANVNERHLIDLVKAGIEVYSSHTCFDAAPGCMNDYFCEILGIRKPVSFAGNVARIGKLKEPLRLSEYEQLVSEKLGRPVGMMSGGDPRKLIRTVAVCTGYGGEFWEEAYKLGADLFITGEIKHHEASYMRDAEIAFIQAGHAGTEWIFVPRMAQLLELQTLGQLEILCTENHQIPFDRAL